MNEQIIASWEEKWLDPDYDLERGRYYEDTDEDDQDDIYDSVDNEVDERILERVCGVKGA